MRSLALPIVIGACTSALACGPAGVRPAPHPPVPSSPPVHPPASAAPTATAATAGPAACAPLDVTAAAAADELLAPLAQSLAPSAAAPVGSVLAGQCLPGEALVVEVPLRRGHCYTVLGVGLLPVADLELELGEPLRVRDESHGPRAALGVEPACLAWDRPDAAVRLTARVKGGQGVVAVRVYESLRP